MSEGLYPVISLATHRHSPSHEGTCIDNIFTNEIEDICISEVKDCYCAKHIIYAYYYYLTKFLTTKMVKNMPNFTVLIRKMLISF